MSTMITTAAAAAAVATMTATTTTTNLLTTQNSNQTSSTNTKYMCEDYYLQHGTSCPTASGNPDIAGFGVVLSFTVTLLLPIALAALAAISSTLQYFCMHTRATVAANISKGNDIVPVWPQRLAQHLGTPAASLSARERRLKRFTNYILSMILGLSDQVLLQGLLFITLQVIGLARGTMDNLDFRTLATMVILCAETQLVCLYTLQPVLTCLDLPMLSRLQWRYLDRTSADIKKSFNQLHDAPAEFRRDLVSSIRGVAKDLAGEAQQMIDSVPSQVNNGAPSGRFAMRIRGAGHVVLLATLPVQVFAIALSRIYDNNGGCSALCVFRSSGQAFAVHRFNIEVIDSFALALPYIFQLTQSLWPNFIRQVVLTFRLFRHRIGGIWTGGCAYVIFTISQPFRMGIKPRNLTTANELLNLCLYSLMAYFCVVYGAENSFALIEIDVCTGIGMIPVRMILVAKGMALFITQFVSLYEIPVMAATSSDALQNVGGTGKWTDGQILPLLMLVGTLVVIVQSSSGGDVTDTGTYGREATIHSKLPLHKAFITGDKTIDLKIERFIFLMSAWDLPLRAATFHYFFYSIFGHTPIPGDSWSHKGLQHLGLLPDPSEQAANDAPKSETISISQDHLRDLVEEIAKGEFQTWFEALGLSLEDTSVDDVDELLTRELNEALEKLEIMEVHIKDAHLLDRPVRLMLKILEYLAVAVARWKHKAHQQPA